MGSPRFKEMATSPTFLNALYYAIKREELKAGMEEVKAEVPRPPSPPEPQVSQEEALKQLVDMGFESNAAQAALLACNGPWGRRFRPSERPYVRRLTFRYLLGV